jgi:hypothetical protein
LQTEIEDMHLPNPVIRSHYGNSFMKQYVRDHLILRTEAATNNVNDYGVNKAVENLPKLREKLSAINDNYQNVQQDILETFIDRGQLRTLAEPTVLPCGKRIPGLKLDHPVSLRSCMLWSGLPMSPPAPRSPRRNFIRTSRKLSAAPPPNTVWRPCATICPSSERNRWSKSCPTHADRLVPRGYSVSLVFLKLFERIYAALAAGLLAPCSRRQEIAATETVPHRPSLPARYR